MTTKTEKSKLDAFLDAASALGIEDFKKLREMGFIVPLGDLRNPKRKFGYYCRGCGGIALEFLGESFINSQGQVVPMPPPDMPVESISWDQPQARFRMIRTRPKCQNCRKELILASGQFFEKGRVVILEEWYRSRGQNRKVEAPAAPPLPSEPKKVNLAAHVFGEPNDAR